MSSTIRKKLDIARQELLDLGLRNPLLNYRTLKARGLDIVDERPEDVYQIVVSNKKKMTFLTREQEEIVETQPDSQEITSAPASVPQPVSEQSYKDAKLQTNYSEKQIQSRLLNTYTAARTYIEEQGVNILYMALGMLKWYEADSSQEPRHAPLILIPVKIDRVSARERFTLTYTEEDIGHNVSLIAKMKIDFGITIPEFDDEETGINDYFSQVENAAAGQKRWSVDYDSVVIGFFSFGKFLMYWDLDVDNWPEHANQLEHPVITALLQDGFNEPSSAIRDDDQLDQFLKPEQSNLIKEADSSQLLAITDAIQGRNLVIQGPPGTGKSQTITNLIAEAIGNGKKVLFVSEKMAALEVVKRRLDEAGLGIACLELHSHKTNKKSLLNELSTTLDLGRPVYSPNNSAELLDDLRNRLNDYCEAIHSPIGNSGVTPYRALGELTRYNVVAKQVTFPKIQLEAMGEWTSQSFNKFELLIEELQSTVRSMGLPSKHPFWGSRKSMIMPYELDELRIGLLQAIEETQSLHAYGAELATVTQYPQLSKQSDVNLFIELGKRIMQAPSLARINLLSDKWVSNGDKLKQLIELGQKNAALRFKWENQLLAAAWEQDVLEARQSIIRFQGKWWGFISSDYRRAKNKIRALYRSPDNKNLDYLGTIDAILEVQQTNKSAMVYEGLARELFDGDWNGMNTDWERAAQVCDWVNRLQQDIRSGVLPDWTIRYVNSQQHNPDMGQMVSKLEQLNHRYISSLDRIESILEFDGAVRFENQLPLMRQDFSLVVDMLAGWSEHVPTVQTLVSFNQLSEACKDQGLKPFIELAVQWELSGERLLDCLRWNWYQTLAARAFKERPSLSQFEGSRHAHTIQKFGQLDMDLTYMNRYKLAEAHWRKLPQYDAGGQLGVLRREFEKKTRHLPIRQLMLRAGNAIQAIKPVFMMSPLSIATFLNPGSLEFDLVIFDEASQVKPVDAFGAIIRGKQVVVVGDSKQMPPSNFFDSISKEDDLDDDDDHIARDMESILGLCVGQNAPQRMLRWHYRSRHESLITVSNHEFYDHKLVIFPSPDADRSDSGLISRYLGHTSYDRGRSRTNKLEAAAVAQAVMEHARDYPMLSLGVAAFSMAQMQAIIDELELLRRADPSCESYFASHAHEPFFVKNLENVQGDERDVIYISIGYGKTAEGYLAMDFGALNREGGERRLNVLITRARLRCEVFTNLKSEDIDLNRSGARGVKALKTFLQYAESGRLDVPVATKKEADSPFEEAVFKQLTDAGYELQKQVGSAGFYIDMAVIDPLKPGKYMIGIECDGASYHSARSARDRDRLRQEVLQGLGWTIHRIWSTDWFRHPERELARVIEAIEKARLGLREAPEPKPLPVQQVPQAPAENEEIQRESNDGARLEQTNQENPKYVVADILIDLVGQELHSIPIATLASWVHDIVRVESPIHSSEVVRRLSELAGLKRAGTRIQAIVEEAIRYLTNKEKIVPRGDFLWIPDMQVPIVRDRSELAFKKIELIAPQEIAAAIRKVVEASYGMNREDLPQAICQLFGLSRATDDVKGQVENIVSRMIASEQLTEKGNQISPIGPI